MTTLWIVVGYLALGVGVCRAADWFFDEDADRAIGVLLWPVIAVGAAVSIALDAIRRLAGGK